MQGTAELQLQTRADPSVAERHPPSRQIGGDRPELATRRVTTCLPAHQPINHHPPFQPFPTHSLHTCDHLREPLSRLPSLHNCPIGKPST